MDNQTTTLETIRELLTAYLEEVEESDRRHSSPGRWIFQPTPPHERYVTSIAKLIEGARAEGFGRATQELTRVSAWNCCCRCRLHSQRACPLCLNTWGCPIHTDADPSTLREDFLSDPTQIFDAILETFHSLSGSDLDLSSEDKSLLLESLRRMISARIQK
jgi:hypothetical protein